MPRKRESDRIELVYGTLDMLVLRTLRWGPAHGHGIAKSIERMSEDALKVDHGSLYPALQRLLQEGWITAEWGVSDNNQRAKYYRLTAGGRRKLATETSRWERFVRAVTGVLRPAEAAGLFPAASCASRLGFRLFDRKNSDAFHRGSRHNAQSGSRVRSQSGVVAAANHG